MNKLICLILICINFFQIQAVYASNSSKESKMQESSKYRIIKITNSRSVRLTTTHDDYGLLDIRSLQPLINQEMEEGKALAKYINSITHEGSRSFILQEKLSRDELVYHSKHWTQKSSVLKIVKFKTLGLESDLNAYLGPLASIPTTRYGEATYELSFGGEKIQLVGPAFKEFWSLKGRYWASSQLYLPYEIDQANKIAIIRMDVPISYMNDLDYFGIYAIIPKSFDE